MKPDVKPIPEGYQAITPFLTAHDAAKAIDFYKEAFGAEERYRMTLPDGKSVAHAELKIGDSVFMLSDEMPGQSCEPSAVSESCVGFYLYVNDVDDVFERAVAAGAKVKEPVKDEFWGDRVGKIADPSGHVWMLATHVEDVSPEELRRRGQEMFEKMMQETGQS
jgi:PhnB protein